jgi:hypothetical protein
VYGEGDLNTAWRCIPRSGKQHADQCSDSQLPVLLSSPILGRRRILLFTNPRSGGLPRRRVPPIRSLTAARPFERGTDGTLFGTNILVIALSEV